jgi:predicted nucleotidyltransferase
MGENDRQIVMEFKQRLSTKVSRHLKKVILYGSRAKGDAAADSDLDLIALLDEKTPELEQLLDDAAYNVMWDHDFNPIISIKVFEEARFRSAAQKGFSFYRNIEREGIEL